LLGLEPHTSPFKPFNRVPRLESLERSDQFLRSPRKTRRQFARLKTMMRHVATSASGNPNLREETRPFLQHRYLRIRISLRASDRGKDSGRAPANDNHSLFFWITHFDCAFYSQDS